MKFYELPENEIPPENENDLALRLKDAPDPDSSDTETCTSEDELSPADDGDETKSDKSEEEDVENSKDGVVLYLHPLKDDKEPLLTDSDWWDAYLNGPSPPRRVNESYAESAKFLFLSTSNTRHGFVPASTLYRLPILSEEPGEDASLAEAELD